MHVEYCYGGGARDPQFSSATAVWRHYGLPAVPIRWVLIRDPRKPDAPTQASPCTDIARHPGVDRDLVCPPLVFRDHLRRRPSSPRRRNAASMALSILSLSKDPAIAPTTPCLLGLFSIVTLLATRLPARQRCRAMTAALLSKAGPTFSDLLAAVRRAIWRDQHFQAPLRQPDRRQVPFRPLQA